MIIDWFSDTSFWDISLANWLLACAAAVLTYTGMRILLGLVKTHLKRPPQGTLHRFSGLLPEIFGSTSNIVLLITSLLVGVAVLDLPPRWSDRVNHMWFLALGLQLALWANKALTVGVKRYFSLHADQAAAVPTVSHTLIVWGLQALLWVVFFLAMLSNVGINITAFIASLGIGGVAVALAVQNILGDLFASLSIAVDKPFEVGDAIDVEGQSGTVEHVGLKSTRIRANSGEQIVISNASLLKNTIRNFKRMINRRVEFQLKIDCTTAPEQAAQLPAVIKEIVESQPKVRFERAHFKRLGQDALDFEIVYFVLEPDYTLFMDVQQKINLSLLKKLEKMDISFASQARTFNLSMQEGKALMARAASMA